MVLGLDMKSQDIEYRELVKDLLSIVTMFTARHNDYDHKRRQFSFLKEIKKSEVIDIKNKNEIIISRDKLNTYDLLIPISLSMRNEKEEGIISLDPGVRLFLTEYDPGGDIVEFCKNNFSRLSRLCVHYDKYQSQSTKVNSRKCYVIKRKIQRIYYKIHNLVNDCHKKIVRYLCDNYQMIVLPIFETQEIINEYPSRRLIICTKEYISKTCGRCGYIKNNFDRNKKFKCDEYGLIIDRDVNGARNILLKLLSQVTPNAVAYYP
ncbi:38716_t:CDS:2 [Gigaspora margarita]|uniref:38716_t:CDS:1 n=1 Tax=Gigaspora margarita TaxID=4874 RepID=A0ABN7VSC7_GIGMA|nr:38716_t:CDS:2 [Gigaspora margarita]